MCPAIDNMADDLSERTFIDSIVGIAGRVRTIQAGSIHAYLAYIFVTLILLLLFGVRG